MVEIAQERAELHGYDMCYDMGMKETKLVLKDGKLIGYVCWNCEKIAIYGKPHACDTNEK